MTHEELDQWVQTNWEQKVDTVIDIAANRGVFAPRPTVFFASDTNEVSFWGEGPSWIEMGGTASGSSIVYPNWIDGTDYQIGDRIIEGNQIYICVVAGVQITDFATNLTASSWVFSNHDIVDPNGKTIVNMIPDPMNTGEYIVDTQHPHKRVVTQEGVFYRDKGLTDTWGNALIETFAREAVTPGALVVGNSNERNILVSNNKSGLLHYYVNPVFPIKIEEAPLTITTAGLDYIGTFDDSITQRVYGINLQLLADVDDIRLTYYLADVQGASGVPDKVIYDSHTDVEWDNDLKQKPVATSTDPFTELTFEKEMFRVNLRNVFFRIRFKTSCNLGDGLGGVAAPVIQIRVRDAVQETVATKEAMFGTNRSVKSLGCGIGWMEGSEMNEGDATTSIHAEQTVKVEQNVITASTGDWGTVGDVIFDEIRTRRPDSGVSVSWEPMTMSSPEVFVDSNAKPAIPFEIPAGESSLIAAIAFKCRDGFSGMIPCLVRILDAEANNSVMFEYITFGVANTAGANEWGHVSISNPPYLDAGRKVHIELYRYSGGQPFSVAADENGRPYFKFLRIPYHWATLQYAEDNVTSTASAWCTNITGSTGNSTLTFGSGNEAHKVASFSLEDDTSPTIHLEWELGGTDIPEVEGVPIENIVRNGSLYSGSVTLVGNTWNDGELNISMGSVDTTIPYTALVKPNISGAVFGVYPTTNSRLQTAVKAGDTMTLTIDMATVDEVDHFNEIEIIDNVNYGATTEKVAIVSTLATPSTPWASTHDVTIKVTETVDTAREIHFRVKNTAGTWSDIYKVPVNLNYNNLHPSYDSNPTWDYPGTQTAVKDSERIQLNTGTLVSNPTHGHSYVFAGWNTRFTEVSDGIYDKILANKVKETVPITMTMYNNDNGAVKVYNLPADILDEATVWDGVVKSYRMKLPVAPEDIVLGTNNAPVNPVWDSITVANTSALSNGVSTELTNAVHGSTIELTNAAGRIDTVAYQFRTKGFEERAITLNGPLAELDLALHDLTIVTDADVVLSAIATFENGSKLPMMEIMVNSMAEVVSTKRWHNDSQVIKTSTTGNGSIWGKGYNANGKIDIKIEELG